MSRSEAEPRRRGVSRETFSEHRLEAMLRDGWTPQDVRDLIASYRELAQELGFVGEGYVRPKQVEKRHRAHCFETVERELRGLGVTEIHLGKRSAQVMTENVLQTGEGRTLTKAVEVLRADLGGGAS